MAASDLIADILHYVRERGESPAEVMSRAWTGYIGDYEDEPPDGATPPPITHADPGDEHVD